MFKNILFPVNLQETSLSDKALKLVVHSVEATAAKLTVMAVAPGFGMPIVAAYFPAEAFDQAMKEIARQLQAYTVEKLPAGIKAKTVVTEGNPSEQIVRYANENGVDLIIMPSHDQTLGPAFLGSVAARVVRYAHCSVMVVKGD